MTSAPIQRYAATVLTAPYARWAADTNAVRPSESGVSGGVYLLTGAAPVPRVVIKPIHTGEAPEQYALGDAVLSELDVGHPTARTVNPGGEYNTIREVLRPGEDVKKASLAGTMGLAVDDPQFTDFWDQQFNLDLKVEAYYVMGAVAGGTLREASGAKKSHWDPAGQPISQARVIGLVALLGAEETCHAIGRMMVADALMGNRDRLTAAFTNIGNFFVTGDGAIQAIDTTADVLGDAQNDSELDPNKENMLIAVADPAGAAGIVAAMIGRVKDGLTESTRDVADPVDPPLAVGPLNPRRVLFDQLVGPLQQMITDQILVGVTEGLDKVQATFFGHGAEGRGRLRAAGGDPNRPDKKASYARLEANARYLRDYRAALNTGPALGRANRAKAAGRRAWQGVSEEKINFQSGQTEQLAGNEETEKLTRLGGLLAAEDDLTVSLKGHSEKAFFTRTTTSLGYARGRASFVKAELLKLAPGADARIATEEPKVTDENPTGQNRFVRVRPT